MTGGRVLLNVTAKGTVSSGLVWCSAVSRISSAVMSEAAVLLLVLLFWLRFKVSRKEKSAAVSFDDEVPASSRIGTGMETGTSMISLRLNIIFLFMAKFTGFV